MNALKIFENSEFGKIQVIERNGEPWFIGKEVAEILGYKDTADALKKHVDEEDKQFFKVGETPTLKIKSNYGAYIINESGLYSLVLSSKLKKAKEFKRWVTSEVIPAVRKHGGYLTNEKIEEVLNDPDTIIKLATSLKEERARRAETERQLEAAKPKVIFADAVSASDNTVLIGELAKIIKQNGKEMGQKRLFDWLRDNGYLIKQKCADYNMPTQKAMEMGLFRIKKTAITHSDGHVTVSRTVKVTGKGQQYFINKFAKGETNENTSV